MIEPAAVGRVDVAAMVRTAFERYEAALVAGDAEALDAMFWESPATVRFGVRDRQQGHAAIRRWRARQGPLPGRVRSDTAVVTFGADAAVVTTLFAYPGRTVEGRSVEGRQSQTWVRFPEGWRIVTAHVSEIPSGAAPGSDG